MALCTVGAPASVVTSRFCDRTELVGRELGERAGAAVGRADELDQVGLGGLEDVDDGAALAPLETVLGQVTAQLNALEVAEAAGSLPLSDR